MTTPARRPTSGDQPALPFANLPLYELRRKARRGGSGDYALEIWQLPSPATPRLDAPEQVATLKGAGLRLIEARLVRRLARGKINLGAAASEPDRRWPLDEDLALSLGLLFRALAPMRNLERIRLVAEGIEAMSREEAGYWLGMALNRKQPRRVLAALRMLLDTL
jgi:hypothetical protein